MKKESNIVLFALVAFAIVLGFVGVLKPGTVTERVVNEQGETLSVGAAAGPEHTEYQYFKAGYQNGCQRFATTSGVATFTLTSSEIKGERCYIDWSIDLNTTLTTMATTAMPWLGRTAGDTKEFWFRNASTTVTSTITLAAGTGVDIQIAETTGGDLVLEGLNIARLTFMRKNDTDVLVIVDEFKPGD
jgi:hypothetical protein